MKIRTLLRPAPLAAVLLLTLAGCGRERAPEAASAAPPAAAPAASSYAPVNGSSQGDADLTEVSDYELSMDDVQRWYAAQRNLFTYVKAHPEAAKVLESNSDEFSLDDLESRLEAAPGARSAIEDAGLSTRDYGVILMSIFQSGFAQAAIDAGADREQILADAKVNPANLAFMKEHGAEINRMQQQLQRDFPSPRDDESD